jgi:formylglycine-generating enzyme required for sulfatase activity
MIGTITKAVWYAIIIVFSIGSFPESCFAILLDEELPAPPSKPKASRPIHKEVAPKSVISIPVPKSSVEQENERLRKELENEKMRAELDVFKQKKAAQAEAERQRLVAERVAEQQRQAEAAEAARIAASFQMVTLPSGLKMGKYEVTQGQWRTVMGSEPPSCSQGQDCLLHCGKDEDCPVDSVNWNDIQAFLQRLNQQSGQRFRLPTEDEWLMACHAGSSNEYCGSNSVDAVAWYYVNAYNHPQPVGRKQANFWGLYDMSGNVWEWTSTCYEGDCARRVLRGGSSYDGPELVHAAYRGWDYVTNRIANGGFRLAHDR